MKKVPRTNMLNFALRQPPSRWKAPGDKDADHVGAQFKSLTKHSQQTFALPPPLWFVVKWCLPVQNFLHLCHTHSSTIAVFGISKPLDCTCAVSSSQHPDPLPITVCTFFLVRLLHLVCPLRHDVLLNALVRNLQSNLID